MIENFLARTRDIPVQTCDVNKSNKILFVSPFFYKYFSMRLSEWRMCVTPIVFSCNKSIKINKYLQWIYLLETIKFGEFLPVNRIRFVAQQQMINVFNIYTIWTEYFM